MYYGLEGHVAELWLVHATTVAERGELRLDAVEP
jgi:hypothetical protein